MESLIFLGLAILIVVILVMAGVKVVPQSETRVIERHFFYRLARTGLRLSFATGDHEGQRNNRNQRAAIFSGCRP